MTYRQRNIPVTSKEESEAQTDIRLIENYLMDMQNQEGQRRTQETTIKLSEVYGTSGLLRPFGDHHLLKEFSKGVQELRDLPYDEKVFGKRLELLERQITGLLKRDFLIHGSGEDSKTWSSYYSTLNQKQKEIIRFEREKIYSDLNAAKLQQRIKALQGQLEQLRGALVHSQQALEENKIYSQFYEKVKKVIDTGNARGEDIQQLFEEQVLPVYQEFNYNLTNITRVINKDVPINIRPLVLSLARELDRTLRQTKFDQDKLSENVLSLINNFKAVKGVEFLKIQFDLAQRTEAAQTKYQNMLSLFNHEIQELKNNHPDLKGRQKLDWLVRKLQDERVELLPINGWMNLVTSDIRVRQISKEDKTLRELLGSLAGQFKRIYVKFPELKNHCSSAFIQTLESQVMTELIEGGSIQRLREIIVHQVDTIKVDNIYNYQNTKDVKLIFHLRVLIKCLLEELYRIKQQVGIELTLDEAILAMLKEQCLDGINVEEVIAMFRPPARFIEVPIVIENKVYESNTYERGVQINKPQPYVITEEKLQVVAVNKQVPVIIEKAVDHVITNQVPVEVVTQKLVEAPTIKEVIIDRVVEQIKQVPTEVQKVVSLYDREQVIQQVQVDKVVNNIQLKQIQRVVQVTVQNIRQVQKIIQKAVICNQIKQLIKQVDVKVPYIITKTQILEVQKRINVVIEKEKPIEVKIEVPVQIKVPELHFIDVVEYRDKPIIVTNTIEKVVPVELKTEKEIVKEIPKEIFIDRSHFIKGDKEEIIKEVEVFVDKPIVQEVLRTKEVEVQKIVPVYITEQIPIVERIPEPYFSEKIKEIEVETVKIVTAKQEVVKPVNVDRPVPIVVEREVVKIQPQFIDRIVEKIVEVPRVVQVQKIVQKIVVVPRIVQKIVEVPKIIQKIVIVKQIELQIVEIPVPQIIIQEVEVPIEIPVEKIVIVKQKQIEQVEVPVIVERKTVEEKPVEVIVERRIPVEVIKEVPVQTYRDRIEYQKVEIHETKVEAIEVQVPFLVQQKVPFIVEKEIVIHEIIKEPQIERVYTEKEKPIISIEEKLVVKEIIIEKPIIIREAVEVPGPETIVTVQTPVEVRVVEEKIVKEPHYVEIIKEVILEHQKIVPIVHERLITVPVNEIVTTPELIEVPKIISLVHYKEIPVSVPVRQERVQSRIVQDTLSVQKRVQVPIQIQISREKIKQIVNQVKFIINQQVVKEINSEVEVLVPTETKIVEVPGQTIIQEIKSEQQKVEVQDKVYERLIEKIIMLPQIVEVVRNIHHVAEVNQLGVAVDVDVNVQTENFIGVSTELKKSLLQLLGTFRTNVGRQPDLKNLIGIIEKHLKFIDDWIAFPKLIEVEKEVIKEVEKERLVVLPTENKQKSATLSFILQKLITELRRVKEAHKIPLSLDEDLLKLFFSERRGDQDMERKFSELEESLKEKYKSFGSWSQSSPFLVSSFLQDHLSLQALVDQANRAQRAQGEQIENLRLQLNTASSRYNNLLCFNRQLFDSNNSLIKTLQKYRSFIEAADYEENIKSHQQFQNELIAGKLPIFLSSIQRITKFTDSMIEGEQQISTVQKEAYIGELVSKLSRYEAESQEIMKKSRLLQSQLTKYTDQLNVKNSIIKRLQTDFDSKLSRARDELAKSPGSNKDLLEQNRKLLEKTRVLEKEFNSQKISSEKAKKEFERAIESQKREMTRQLQRKERQVRQLTEKSKIEFERELKRVESQLERTRKAKERLDDQLLEVKRRQTEQIKNIREQQLSGATDKHNQLITENLELRKSKDQIEAEYQKLKKLAADSNAASERQTQKLKAEKDRLLSEKKEWEKKSKEGFLDLPAETQIINKNIELEKRIKILEADLSKFKGKDETSLLELRTLRDKVQSLEVQLEIARKELDAYQKMKSTTFQSGYKSAIGSESGVEMSLARSPEGIFKSPEEKPFVSPERVQSQERLEELGSSSSRFSHESSEEKTIYKPQMTLREFMDLKQGDEKDRDVYTTYVMIKIIEAVEREAENGVYNSYSPDNIHLLNFNVKKLDTLTVKFGAHIIDKSNNRDGLYLAPEVLGGSVTTKKSVVFCLGVILDELIHGAPYFRSTEDIQNMHIQFKVRGEKLNPILKNTLFQMMNKEPTKRLELIEAKRRLSLQKYITSEGRSSVTTHQRLSRRREQ